MDQAAKDRDDQQGEPVHPHLQAGLLMAGIVVLLLALALASALLA